MWLGVDGRVSRGVGGDAVGTPSGGRRQPNDVMTRGL